MSINFSGGDSWGAVSQTDCQRKARDPDLPLFLRVYFAALWKANRIGHAEFAEGALATVLADKAGKPLSRQSASNAVGRAKALGLVHEGSGARCLVLPRWHFQKDGKGTAHCVTHGERMAA